MIEGSAVAPIPPGVGVIGGGETGICAIAWEWPAGDAATATMTPIIKRALARQRSRLHIKPSAFAIAACGSCYRISRGKVCKRAHVTTAHRNGLVLFALVCAGVAAGCGGSTSGGIQSIPTPTPNPTLSFPPPPPPVPTNNSYFPSPGPSETNLYQFAGFIVTKYVRPPVTQSPLPSPNPTSSAFFASIVTQGVNAFVGPVFNGIPGLLDFEVLETETGSFGQFNTVPIQTDTYYNFVNGPNKTTSVYEAGYTSLYEVNKLNQIIYKTVYGQGNGLVDVIPEPSNRGQSVPVGPQNNASMQTKETDPDGQVTSRTINPDGSYTEKATYPDGTTGTATVNSDGTAVYSFPLFGVTPNSSVVVGRPSGGLIPVTVNYAAGINGPNPTQVNYTIKDWYPKTPPVLSTESYINTGPHDLPNPYPTPSPIPTDGACDLGLDAITQKPLTHIQEKPFPNKLIQTITKTDPLFGEVETTTTTTYVTQGVGATCWETVDQLEQFYDYSGQSSQTPYFSSTPVQITTTDVTMGLGFATINNQSLHFPETGRRRRPEGRGGGFGHQNISIGRQSMSMGRQMQSNGQQMGMGGNDSLTEQSHVLLAVKDSVMQRFERQRAERHALFWRHLGQFKHWRNQ